MMDSSFKTSVKQLAAMDPQRGEVYLALLSGKDLNERRVFDVLFPLTKAYVREGKYALAIASGELLIGLDPASYWARYVLCKAYLLSGQVGNAFDEACHIMTACPTGDLLPDLLKPLAEALDAMGEFKSALSVWMHLSRHDQSGSDLSRTAYAMAKTGALAKATDLLSRGESSDADETTLGPLLYIYMTYMRWSDALIAARKLIALDPANKAYLDIASDLVAEKVVWPSAIAPSALAKLGLVEEYRRMRLKYFIFSREHRFIYSYIPKNGTTTILNALNRILHVGDVTYPGDIHLHMKKFQYLSDIDYEEAMELLSSRDWFKFVFVRNPYSRILSAYLNKIVRPDKAEERVTRVRQHAIRLTLANSRSTLVDYDDEISFRDFCEFLQVTDPADYDGHWAVQADLAMVDRVNYDLVGRLENFAADFSEVLKVLGISGFDPSIKANVTGASEKMSHYYSDDDIKGVIAQTYRRDLEAFGYSCE